MASCPTYSDVFVSPECSSADGLAAVIASCSPLYQGMEEVSAPVNCHKRLYSIFEEEAGEEEMSDEVAAHQVEKKRRLSVEQVKALEKNFEIENKLEPERKIQLARELGLQPRQVAVWFQNRRARWKTKQLEKDYDLLKSEYDELKNSFVDLVKEKDSLLSEVARLRERLTEAGTCENTRDSATRAKGEDKTLAAEDYTPPAANYSSKVEVPLAQALNSHQVGSFDQFELVASCKKEGSLSSDSDASEVLEVESPRPRFDTGQDHSPAGIGVPGGVDTTSFTPQQVSTFLLHEDLVSYKGSLFPSSFPHRSLLLGDHQQQQQQQQQQHQQLLEDQGCQATPFTWSWDPWA